MIIVFILEYTICPCTYTPWNWTAHCMYLEVSFWTVRNTEETAQWFKTSPLLEMYMALFNAVSISCKEA